MARNFGWDWGPDVATVGIWRPIRIESWSGVRIDTVRPLAGLEGDRGVLTTHVALAWADGAAPTRRSRSRSAARSRRRQLPPAPRPSVASTVDAVDLWWPRGHGEQPLYDVTGHAGRPRTAGRAGSGSGRSR